MNLEIFTRGALSIHYRPNTIDRSIITEVVERDDYRVGGLDVPDGGLIIDVGAHIGVFSCLAASMYPRARVFACELDKENAEILTRNAARYGNITALHRMVVGDVIPSGYHRNTDNTGGHHIAGRLPPPPAVTLADLTGGGRVAFLKMDCEGAEYGILRRAASDGTLAQVDRIAMEYHNFFGECGASLVPLLESAGLSVDLVAVNSLCGMIHAVRPTQPAFNLW